MIEKNGNTGPDSLHFDEEVCERYVFGELSEDEQEEFETAYFNDDVFFDRFMAVKNELLDLYARGELDAEKLARMQPHFLATEPRMKRLAESGEFIRAVTAISDRKGVPKAVIEDKRQHSWVDSIVAFVTLPRLAGAIVLLVLISGGILVVDLWRPGNQGVDELAGDPRKDTGQAEVLVENLPSSNANQTVVTAKTSDPNVNTAPPSHDGRPGTLASSHQKGSERRRKNDKIKVVASSGIDHNSNTSVQTPRPVQDSQITLATVGRDDTEPDITLRAGSTRDISPGNTLTLRPDIDRGPARIGFLFNSEEYSKYIVTLSNVDGQLVSKKQFDKRSVVYQADGSKRATIVIPNPSRLTGTDYIVTLQGRTAQGKTETIEEYYFNLQRPSK